MAKSLAPRLPRLLIRTNPRRAWHAGLLGLLGLTACPASPVTPTQDALHTLQSGPALAPGTETKTVALIGTSDLHGYVEGRSLQVRTQDGHGQTVLRGGLALLGGYLEVLRRRMPTILLDGGDMFQGTMVSNLGEGQAVVDAYNVLGYQAAAIGNHEFDFGPTGPRSVPKRSADDDPNGALKDRAAAAKFPFLSANLLDRRTGQPVTWTNVFPSKMIDVNGIPVGIIGALTEDTPRTTNILNLREVLVAPIVPAVLAEASKLRAQGAAAVLLTIHEGANCGAFDNPRDASSCKNNDQRIFQVVQALGGAVDAVVAGHSHAGVAHFAGDVPILQAFSYGVAFGRADLTFVRTAGGPWRIDRAQTKIHPPTAVCEMEAVEPGTEGALSSAAALTRESLYARCDAKQLEGHVLQPTLYDGQPVTRHAGVVAALQGHVQRAENRANMPLQVAPTVRIRKNFRNESPLAQLLADLLWTGATRVLGRPVDLALQNGGGIRNELPAGPLTYGSLFEVLPFDNRLAIIRMTGAQIGELFRRNLVASNGVLVPAGMIVSGRCEAGGLLVEVRKHTGELLLPTQEYLVAVSDFLASGGDSFSGLVPSAEQQAAGNTGPVMFYDDVILRELLLEELQRYRGPLLQGQPIPKRLHLQFPRPMKCTGHAEASSAEPE